MPTPGLLYQDYGDHIKSLLWDFLVFAIKSFIYILEAIYLTIIPDRFRKLKVKWEREKESGLLQFVNASNDWSRREDKLWIELILVPERNSVQPATWFIASK